MQVQNEINELDGRMKNVEVSVNGVAKDVKDVRKRAGKIEKKTVDIIARNYDEGDVVLAIRVKRIEAHLSLPQF